MPRVQPLRDHFGRLALADLPFFGTLSEASREAVYDSLELVSLRAGEVLYRQGEPGSRFSVVLHGRLASVEGDRVLAELVRGDCLGEISFLMEEPHSRTIVARRDSLLAGLPHERLAWLLGAEPGAMLELSRRLIAEARRPPVPFQPGERLRTFAVLPASRGVDMDGFCRDLAGALGERVVLLDAWSAAPLLADEESLIAWMNEQERTHACVVYQAEAEAGPWTGACVRQADCVLRVGRGEEEPAAAGEVGEVRQELVLLWRDGGISGTARWLDAWPVDRHHHVQGPDDMRRLARILLGRGWGLVLSGGGARGFAHIGVLRAFEEAGLPIDRIGGTSSGSILAALMGRRMGWREMAALARERFSDARKLYDFTVPFVAVLKGEKVHRLLEEILGDRQIEDMPIDWFCVSTNLSRAEPRVHRRGSVLQAVLRSIAVPGVAPLYQEDGHFYCDGGLVDNLPVDAMASRGPGPIVSVDVSPVLLEEEGRRRPGPVAGLLHLHHPSPDGEPSPLNILDTLMRTVYVGANYAQRFRQRAADLALEPPVSRFALTDWHAIDEFIEIGYHHARERLATSPARSPVPPASPG